MNRPIKELLEISPGEPALRRGWDAIEARLPRTGAPRRRTGRALGLAAAIAAAAAGGVLLVGRGDGGDGPRPADMSGPAALALADGRPLPLDLMGEARLSDGSRIFVAGGRVEVIENAGGAVRLVLPAGTAHFEIRPGGPRRWTIDAGAAQVEVVGTELTVARTGDDVAVSVVHGIVVVRGERVPGLVRRLQAGESLQVSGRGVTAAAAEAVRVAAPAEAATAEAARAAAAAKAAEAEAARAAAPAAPTPSQPPTTTGEPRPTPTATQPAGEMRGARLGTAPAGGAASVPPTGGAASTPPTAQQLLSRADALRNRGELAAAVDELARVAGAPADPVVAIAWFTRARLLLELNRQAEAAIDLERAIAGGLPPALEARARARLAELSKERVQP